jgi:hypothetical protein
MLKNKQMIVPLMIKEFEKTLASRQLHLNGALTASQTTASSKLKQS